MANETTISKWGNSLAVRIPLALARQANLNEGDCVALTLERDGSIVLRTMRRKKDTHSKWRFPPGVVRLA